MLDADLHGEEDWNSWNIIFWEENFDIFPPPPSFKFQQRHPWLRPLHSSPAHPTDQRPEKRDWGEMGDFHHLHNFFGFPF